MALLLGALLACKLPGTETDKDGSAWPSASEAPAVEASALTTVADITAYAEKLDCAVGKGTVRVTEVHNSTGMGSSVIVFELEGRIVKIVRRTELGPPTLLTAFYFAGDALVLTETRHTDLLVDSPRVAPDRRYYAADKLLGRTGKPASDAETDAERAAADHAVARVLLDGARERLPALRLPEGVW